MEIIYYFKEKDTLMDKWQTYHIFDELKRYDINVTVFNPLKYGSTDESNEEFINHIKTKKYDLFMTPHNSKDIYIETVIKIKALGIPTLLICFDNLIVPFNHKQIAKYFDLVWLTSEETEEMFKKWGATTIFNPYAANPFLMRSQFTEEILSVAFIGTPYGSRVNMINTLIENEINVDLFGNRNIGKNNTERKQLLDDFIIPMYNLSRFKIGRRVLKGAFMQKLKSKAILDYDNTNLRLNDPVSLVGLSELYSNFALSLSSTAARNTGVLKKPVNIVNLRSFEIPMSGGIQICSYSKELSKYFDEDKEIIFYRSEEELIDKANFYLRSDNATLREQIKLDARKRAVRDHTWKKRFDIIFDELGVGIEK
ncbi:glycosyltransferase [Trichococcus shcherbakoviae]|uniref:glycosyltransferase n=1 Tax=Trichococcus shcherbakoviae TaxID=2094020 RepID=UPI002AA81454|nr:glycosyltransferase [Trichococcus shcherbakoviae]